MQPLFMSATGNTFAVLDGFAEPWPERPAELAARLCARERPALDGLLLVGPPSEPGADCRMLLYNRDGSRAETCGNGLRCAAKLVYERGHVPRARFAIECDAGTRAVELELDGDSVRAVRVSMGRVAVESGVALEVDGRRLAVAVVDVGNPHCVLFADAAGGRGPAGLAGDALEHLGPLLARHPRFPRGTNVEIAWPAADRGAGPGHELAADLEARFWERGVGETASCGSGACAVAAAAIRGGLARSPVRIATAGGALEVCWDGRGEALLAGAVEEPRALTEWSYA